jgi:hypothetical protein
MEVSYSCFWGEIRKNENAAAGAVGKLGIPPSLRDFRAQWESPAFGLFHEAGFPTALLPTDNAIGVSSQGHINQSVKVRPRLEDSSLVAWEAPWRESKTAKPSDNILEKGMRNAPGCNVQ